MIRLEQGDCLEVMDRLIEEGVKVDAPDTGLLHNLICGCVVSFTVRRKAMKAHFGLVMNSLIAGGGSDPNER